MQSYGGGGLRDRRLACPAGWLSNLFVVVDCLLGHLLLPKKSVGDLGKFAVAFALTTGFFALDMAIFQPRYLGLFPRILHPGWPF